MRPVSEDNASGEVAGSPIGLLITHFTPQTLCYMGRVHSQPLAMSPRLADGLEPENPDIKCCDAPVLKHMLL